jgi:hypothetical protein
VTDRAGTIDVAKPHDLGEAPLAVPAVRNYLNCRRLEREHDAKDRYHFPFP